MLLVWLVVAAFMYWPIKALHVTYDLKGLPPFINALLWPLFLAFIAWMIVSEKMSKKKKGYSSENAPSWVKNKRKQKEFIAVLYLLGAKNNIPDSFIKENFTNELFFDHYLQLTKNLADKGFPITAQAEAVFSLILKDWKEKKGRLAVSHSMASAIALAEERRLQRQQVEELRKAGVDIPDDLL